ncbi:lysophospholipid acyltransferase family protein [Marinagarivorans algicola]|uniref:lysophospholipid acyltransferase family protein n=1 Tax=Marinagarivorans algicola TaxID=1513270 RepID=UPI003736E1FD
MTNPLALTDVSPPIRWVINRLSRLDTLKQWYDEWLAGNGGDAADFLDYTLDKTGINFDVLNESLLNNVAQDKPIVFVANHPLGGLEGMLLSRLLLRYRPDLKVLTNQMLLCFKEFNELFIGVDVLNPNKQAENAKGMRLIAKHLGKGGALLVFPSGTVGHIQVPQVFTKHWTVTDAPWQDIVGRLAMKYKAECVPIYVSGKNTRAFYLTGLIHARLRTLLLPRAMIAKQNESIQATIGEPIILEKGKMTPEAATDYLRLACEFLADDNAAFTVEQAAKKKVKSLATSTSSPEAIQNHLTAMGEYCVLTRGDFKVYVAPYAALGPIAQLLAVEREHTFRAIGEGTGLVRDVDRFDEDYDHIFIWDTQQSALVGGYRAANVKHLVDKKGLKGLYSYSLFAYDKRLLATLGGSIEVGRSFITPVYQRDGIALDTLWCGLGHYLLQHPQCHTLFGCVSISQTFAPIARAVLVDALLEGYGADDKTRALVKAHSPFTFKARFWSKELITTFANFSIINKLLGQGAYQQRVPALIRHYAALKGKFIDFSVNHGFSQSLDGLIYVDLRQTPERYLKRYLGADGAELFKTRWQQKNAA